MPSQLIILTYISSAISIYSILGLIFLRPRAIDRLEKYFNPNREIDSSEGEKGRKNAKIKLRKLLNRIGTGISETMLMKKYIKKIQEELIKAGLPLKGEELLSVKIICFVLIFVCIYSSVKNMPISIIIGIFGWLMPDIIVKLRKRKRYKMFNEQLGDAIVLISNSLKAGYSFLQAVDSVATEMPPPISDEFNKLLKELRLGVETERALENFLKRVESEDLELVVTAVMIQREIGGNLSEILDNISTTIRERVKLKGEIRTLTAQGRISGIIISLLPIALGAILFAVNPQYIKTLFRNRYGIIIVIISIVNQLIGVMLINKIVKIEV